MKKARLYPFNFTYYRSYLLNGLKTSLFLLFGVIIPSSALLAADLSATNNNSENNKITFASTTVYAETDGVHFGTITSVAVDHQSRVFMADNSQHAIHIFSPDGSYIKSLGQEGQGPGEFNGLNDLMIDSKYLHALDRNQRRISVFNLNTLSFSHSVPLSTGGQEQGAMGGTFPSQVSLLSDGNYLVFFTSFGGSSPGGPVVLSPEGKIIDQERFKIPQSETITRQSGGGAVMLSLPAISKTTFISSNGNGNVYVNQNWDLEVNLYQEDGKLIRTISKPYKNHPMTRSGLIDSFESTGGASDRLKSMLQQIELPETWPAVNRIYSDKQNRIWVSTYTNNTDLKNWVLFGESGNEVASFEWANSKRVVHVTDQHVYTLEQDEFELPLVVKYSYHINN